MRCALVVPAWVPEDIFPVETAGSQINYWQPLGILYVAASLRAAGHDVRFLDGSFLTHGAILARLRAFDPGFVGIYSTTFGWPKALATAADVKRLIPGAFTCAGGPYPIAAQDRCLRAAGAHFDAVVTGEGERTAVELVARVEAGRDLAGVLGVVFRRGDEIVKNPARPPEENLDGLPFPARELLGDAARYLPPPATYRRKPVAVMMTARGCSRGCIFCFQIDKERKSGRHGVRFRSLSNVLAEIELLLRQGYREIKFLDDTLAADYDRAMALAREIKARRLHFSGFASACFNQFDGPLPLAFREAGCWAILRGTESGVQKNLNTLRKGTTLAQIREAVRAARDAGLKVSTPFVFGIPGETFEEGLKTIEFAIELDPDLANFHALTAFPGTYLYEQRERYGAVSEDLEGYTYQGAAFVPYTMTREEVLRLRQLALRRFYSRPAFIARRLLALRSPGDWRAAVHGAKSLFRLWARDRVFTRDAAAAAQRPVAATVAGTRARAPDSVSD